MHFTAAEIAEHLQGEVIGDGSTPLHGFAAADSCQAGDLTFAENQTYFARAEQSSASAILVNGYFASSKKVLIRVANARIAFAKGMALFFPQRQPPPGVHPSSLVANTAQIDPSAHIGPFCVIEERVRIGARAVLAGGNHLGPDCRLGEGAHLFSHVILYANTQIGQRVCIHAGTVVGSDGFGYVFDQEFHRKVPQVGNVIIHDDVEIGANVTIDRGALGSTVIGTGSKIDNLVQIGHNVVIGEHCMVVAQVGIAGSTRLGNHVTLAGQVGIAGHLQIGHRATVTAQSGVMNHIPEGEKWLGSPAQPNRQMKRVLIALQRLPQLLRRVNHLEKQLNEATSDSNHE